MVLVTEPKPKGAVTELSGIQSCFEVLYQDHSHQVNVLDVSLLSQNGSPQSWTAQGFSSLLPGSQSSHKYIVVQRGMPNYCWGGEMSEGHHIRSSCWCLSLHFLIWFFHYFCFLSHKLFQFVYLSYCLRLWEKSNFWVCIRSFFIPLASNVFLRRRWKLVFSRWDGDKRG